MPKKKKLQLKDLKVDSFITSDDSRQLNGGFKVDDADTKGTGLSPCICNPTRDCNGETVGTGLGMCICNPTRDCVGDTDGTGLGMCICNATRDCVAK
ncbi:MAG: hypothetical protein GY940_09820 [bacterium]|nr:hypothetical protein [bacterium]